MRSYEYMFYCYYNVFKLIKRQLDIDHILASAFLGIVVSFNLITLLMATGILGELYKIMPLAIPTLGIFALDYYINEFYFIKSGRYKTILQRYNEDRDVSVAKSRIYAIGLTVFTFLAFPITGWLVDKYLNT